MVRSREVDEDVVREKALDLLSFREHSGKELLEKLLARKFPRNLSMKVIHDLERGDLLNDMRFARNLVRYTLKSRPLGRRAMVSLLCRKGLTLDSAQEIVSSVMQEEGVDEQLLIRKFLEKQLKGGDVDEKRWKKAGNSLLRRGFDGSTVRELLAEIRQAGVYEDVEDCVEEL